MPTAPPQKEEEKTTPVYERVVGRTDPLSRTVSRVFIVFGLLAQVAAWRLDSAVRTAYRTDWVAPQFAKRQEDSLFGCVNCWRLPSESWLWAHALTGGAAIILLLIAAVVFNRRHHGNDTPDGVGHLALGAGIAVVLIAIADVVVRQLAARGHGTGLVAVDSALDAVALLGIALIVIASAAGSESTTAGPYTLVRRVLLFLQRQRVNALGVVFLIAALMFVAQTSGQAIDSIRTWGFDSAHSIARLGFGIAAALLLSLVIYESAVLLTQVSEGQRTERVIRARIWFVSGAALLVFGAVLVAMGPFGYGPIVIGVIALILGVLELPDLKPTTPATVVATTDDAETQTRHDERVAEILAVIPLLVFAATGVAAAIDAALSRGAGHGLGPLLPTGILAAAAILMTAEPLPRTFNTPGWPALVAAVVIVGIASFLLVIFHSDVGAAALAVTSCLTALAYVIWVFWVEPSRKRPANACCSALSLPLAAAVGVGVFFAVHWDPFGSANTIGTLALISFALAFWLAALNYLIHKTFHWRPPKALWGIGLQHLPIVTLIAIAWLAAGAIRTPPTLHEARLAARQPVETAVGKEVILDAPTLSEAFDQWVNAQPELSQPANPGGPIPMFLVAAHGGGIRAAYWTALALDCLVGVSSDSFAPEKLQAGDEPTRQATCRTLRRAPGQQQTAANRIFVASGVSGGAVGLYAYARELISERSLGDGSWVDRQLGGDYSSATIGWALFHDVPNHWFGLNSHRGGQCGWKIGSRCMTADRAAILEDAFDRAWPEGAFSPLLRLAWDLRSSANKQVRAVARTVPLLITNATVTGGKARGVVSAVNFGTWPNLEAYDPGRGNFDTHPLAGTVEVVEAACATRDLPLSTAAFLGARFPYVSPSGHLSGQCRRSKGGALEADKSSACASAKAAVCEMRLVDGGYADNSGLFTIDALWPSLRQLVMNFNRASKRKIAPVIVELDNHYQAALDTELAARGTGAESVVPLVTAFGARNSMETFARALAYRLRPPGCTVTISPGLHPGLTAPLGWELSKGARDDLRDGLIRPHPTAVGATRYQPVLELRRLQQWLGAGSGALPILSPRLKLCIPTETFLKG